MIFLKDPTGRHSANSQSEQQLQNKDCWDLEDL